jgi:nucleoside-diphosphate-sugar epimerase
MNITIIGANGFVGSNLIRRLLDTTDHEIKALDIEGFNLKTHKRLEFTKADMFESHDILEKYVEWSDVVLPLAAIANPAMYSQHPVTVFSLDFEENLRIIRYCVAHRKRIIFPSTSEVYGMSPDVPFSEERTNFVLGPTQWQRWIYSCAKQLLERVIWAYSMERGLNFTIIRLFNWFGPRLDTVEHADRGTARVVTQFIVNYLKNKPIEVVGDGRQSRCFTYIEDGIDCLMKIIENKNSVCRNEIFNIGDPSNNYSVKELAYKILDVGTKDGSVIFTPASEFYGPDYQDIPTRIPDVTKAMHTLKWKPVWDFDQGLKETMEYFHGVLNNR